MKKIITIALVALSLVSCSVRNSYTVRSLEAKDHDATTIISTTANLHPYEAVTVNGHAYQVMFVNN